MNINIYGYIYIDHITSYQIEVTTSPWCLPQFWFVFHIPLRHFPIQVPLY